jgi:hypothetical protein
LKNHIGQVIKLNHGNWKKQVLIIYIEGICPGGISPAWMCVKTPLEQASTSTFVSILFHVYQIHCILICAILSSFDTFIIS